MCERIHRRESWSKAWFVTSLVNHAVDAVELGNTFTVTARTIQRHNSYISRFRIDKMISFTTRVQTILCWNSSQSLQNRTFDCRCSWCSKLLFLLFGWSLSFPLSWWNLQRSRPFGDAEFHENRHLYTPLWDNWSSNLSVCVIFSILNWLG